MRLFRYTIILAIPFLLSHCTNRKAQVQNVGGNVPNGDPFTPPPLSSGGPALTIEAKLSSDSNYSQLSITVDEGQSVNLRWSIVGEADNCYVGGVENDALSNNSATIVAAGDVFYDLVCNLGSQQYTKRLQLNVNPTVILEARLSGSGSYSTGPLSIAQNQSVDLRWTLGTGIDSCSIQGTNLNNLTVSGNATVGPLAASASYTLNCQRSLKAPILRQVSVNVSATPPPIVLSLEGRVSGTTAFGNAALNILSYQKIDLRWTIQGNPDSCSIPGISTNALVEGSKNNVSIASTTTLTLSCQRAGSPAVERTLQVNVTTANFQLTITGGNSYDFGLLETNKVLNKTFTVTNSGNSLVTNLRRGFIGAPFQSISFASGCASLDPQQSCTFVARYAPTAAGDHQANFRIDYTGAGTTRSHTLVLSGTAHPPLPAIQRKLQMSYSFDGPDLGKDDSVNGNDASTTSLTSSSNAMAGKSAYFAGDPQVGNHMHISGVNLGSLSEGVSISAWVRPEAKAGNDSLYRLVYGKSGNVYIILHFYDNGNFLCSVYQGTKKISASSPGNYAFDQWHHVVCSFEPQGNNNRLKMIVDGVVVVDHAVSTSTSVNFSQMSFDASNSYFYFGRNVSSNGYLHKGHMDELNIWSRALTDAEMNQLYTSPDVIP